MELISPVFFLYWVCYTPQRPSIHCYNIKIKIKIQRRPWHFQASRKHWLPWPLLSPVSTVQYSLTKLTPQMIPSYCINVTYWSSSSPWLSAIVSRCSAAPDTKGMLKLASALSMQTGSAIGLKCLHHRLSAGCSGRLVHHQSFHRMQPGKWSHMFPYYSKSLVITHINGGCWIRVRTMACPCAVSLCEEVVANDLRRYFSAPLRQLLSLRARLVVMLSGLLSAFKIKDVLLQLCRQSVPLWMWVA